MSTRPCRIILDVDTGIDDAMAILYALGRPGIELMACTTVYGNTEVENATRNTLQILESAGRGDIPVAEGAGRSLLRPYVNKAAHIHGKNGLGEIVLPEPKARPVDEHAIDLILRLARENPGEISLLPVGPITNVALALSKEPRLAELLKEIVIMGSTIFHPGVRGVDSPMADPNFFNDPEAAHIVINSGARILLVGMDVTMKTLLSEDLMAEIAASGGEPAKTMMKITQFYLDAYRSQYAGIRGCGLHDPLAVAAAEDRSLVTIAPMQVDVELSGKLTRGQVVADRRPHAKPNVEICVNVETEKFTRRFAEALMAI
jgi:purine nucleosidase